MLPAPDGAEHPSREGPEFPATQVQFPSMTTPAAPTPPSGEASRAVREEEVRDCLRAVVDPELGDTIVDLGMVRAITVEGGDVIVDVALTIAACPLRSQIERDVVNHVRSLDWVRSVDVQVAAMDADERAAVMARARWKAREDAPETAIASVHPGVGHRLGQGRRRQVVGDGQPGRGAGLPGPGRRDPRRLHLGASLSPACWAWKGTSRPEPGR